VSEPRRPVDDARRSLDAAARSLAALRRLGAAPEEAGARASAESAESAAGLRAALEQSRRALSERARELEEVKARVRELERERTELIARAAPASEPGAEERARRAEAETRRVREAAASESAGLAGRVSLLQAEMVRLESLRRKAEEAAQNSERSRRGVEETLRRELREAHAALDRGAVDLGAREARAAAALQASQRRLEAALGRIQHLERQRRVETEKVRGERERLATALQRAAAAQAALRRDLLEARGEAPAPESAAPGAPPPPSASPARPSLAGGRTWARIVARLRPGVEAAYAQLRGLSATVPLNETERKALRSAASSLAGLVDSVVLLERYLDDGPAGVAGPISPALERAVADWRAALGKRGCRVELSSAPVLPDVRRDLDDLRLVFDQLLRNAFDSLPSGACLSITAAPAANGGVRMAFEDDGAGLPVEARAAAFEPLAETRPGRLGLGLALVRRALRRWGGDAVLEAPVLGGSRVVLLFAPARPAA